MAIFVVCGSRVMVVSSLEFKPLFSVSTRNIHIASFMRSVVCVAVGQCSKTAISILCMECVGKLKCAATVLILFLWTEVLWLLIRVLSAVDVRPTYCMWHLLHLMR